MTMELYCSDIKINKDDVCDNHVGKIEALEYSDKLVRDFIERIDVFETKLFFTMKNGMTTEVEIK